MSALRRKLFCRSVTYQRVSGVVALDDVDLEVRSGESTLWSARTVPVKSTLIKIITGVIEGDAGEIWARGVPVEIGTPRNATRMGITAVPQDIRWCLKFPLVAIFFFVWRRR